MWSSTWTWSFFCLVSALCIATSTTSEADKTKPDSGGKLVFHHGPQRVKRLPDIYWNTSNPIFRIDNTDHIMDVNEGSSGSPFEYDQVNIICPLYDQRSTPNEEDTEKFIIYHVNKEEYDTCRISSPHPRIIAKCDKPYSLRYFTISFRSFSPTPGALEFHAGMDYFFISTSSQSDLHRHSDGMCRTHNMKMVFKVADKTKNEVASTETRVDPAGKLSENLDQSRTTTKRRKGPIKADFDDLKDEREVESGLPGKYPGNFPPGGDESPVVVEEDRRERDGEVFVRKEPKSLDYYLYQTRTNSIPSSLDDIKRGNGAKTNGAVKQEASTGAASSSSTTTTTTVTSSILLLSLCLLVLGRQG